MTTLNITATLDNRASASLESSGDTNFNSDQLDSFGRMCVRAATFMADIDNIPSHADQEDTDSEEVDDETDPNGESEEVGFADPLFPKGEGIAA